MKSSCNRVAKGRERDRLGDQGGNAERTTSVDFFRIIRGGHQDDGKMPCARVRADGSQKLESGHGGKLHVQKHGDQVLRLLLLIGEIGESLAAVGDDFYLPVKIRFGELPHEQRFVIGIVFDDQDSSGKGIHNGATVLTGFIAPHSSIEMPKALR